MLRVIVIGTGNVGWHLAIAIQRLPAYQLAGYHNRSGRTENLLDAPLIKELDRLPGHDLILICVPDDSISAVSRSLPENSMVAHTSGATALDSLEQSGRGAFYIPQSFGKARDMAWDGLPVCIEASDSSTVAILEQMGEALTGNVMRVDSLSRKRIHLAVVYANNFVNHCYTKAYAQLSQHGLEPGILKPLMQETLAKALDSQPYLSQTGPARRGDEKTIKTHLDLLDAEERELYMTMTASIKKSYVKKL